MTPKKQYTPPAIESKIFNSPAQKKSQNCCLHPCCTHCCCFKCVADESTCYERAALCCFRPLSLQGRLMAAALDFTAQHLRLRKHEFSLLWTGNVWNRHAPQHYCHCRGLHYCDALPLLFISPRYDRHDRQTPRASPC